MSDVFYKVVIAEASYGLARASEYKAESIGMIVDVTFEVSIYDDGT